MNDIDVTNPLDGRTVGSVADSTPDDVGAVIARLRAAQPQWEAIGPAARARWLRRLRDWLLDHDDELTDVIASETGKVRPEAAVEVPMVCDMINYWPRTPNAFSPSSIRRGEALSVSRRSSLSATGPTPSSGS